jgi:hypothetical protein
MGDIGGTLGAVGKAARLRRLSQTEARAWECALWKTWSLVTANC